LGCLDGRVLATDIYGVANGIKNADGILLGGFDMVNVQKNLSPDLTMRYLLEYLVRSGVKLSKTLLDAVREECSDRYGSGHCLDQT